jgi:hypothetical protein
MNDVRDWLDELATEGVTYFPNSWFKKITPSWGRNPHVFQIASILLKISWVNGDGAIELPKEPLDKEPIARIGTLRLLSEAGERFHVPYDGVRSTDQCNTACSLSAGVWKPKVFRGR